MITHMDGKRYYKVGLHIHTTRSDGKKDPEAVIAEYKENGYDAIALTDHWKYGLGGEADGMLILPGCEYNSRGHETIGGVMHIVGIGMKEDPQLDRDASRQQIVDAIHRTGGMAVLAHPAWSLNTVADAQALHGVDHTEVFNAVSEAHQSIRAYSDYFADICANAGIRFKLIAADDAHYYDGTDSCKGWVMVHAEDCTAESLLKALRAGDFYASQGPELSVIRQNNKLIVDCSPCKYVAAISNLAWAKARVERGQDITHFEYEIKDNDYWVRVQACDENGKLAWSQIISIER